MKAAVLDNFQRMQTKDILQASVKEFYKKGLADGSLLSVEEAIMLAKRLHAKTIGDESYMG